MGSHILKYSNNEVLLQQSKENQAFANYARSYGTLPSLLNIFKRKLKRDLLILSFNYLWYFYLYLLLIVMQLKVIQAYNKNKKNSLYERYYTNNAYYYYYSLTQRNSLLSTTCHVQLQSQGRHQKYCWKIVW